MSCAFEGARSGGVEDITASGNWDERERERDKESTRSSITGVSAWVRRHSIVGIVQHLRLLHQCGVSYANVGKFSEW